MEPSKILVIGAHAADFVWRAAGTVAVFTGEGGRAICLALSYGERGESGDLWKEPGQTVESVKRIRHAQAVSAAEAVGAEFRCLDLGDYPLELSKTVVDQLVGVLRELQPRVLLTHPPSDPFNPDHPIASQAVQHARLLTTGAGVASAFERISPPELYYFEPHQPELCGFQPNTFVDITSVMDRKLAAMKGFESQSYLLGYYTDLAARRGNHARRISGREDIQFAEALQKALPWVVNTL